MLTLPLDTTAQAGLDQAVADEQQQALRLEGELAKAEAGCLDLEADLSAHDAEMVHALGLTGLSSRAGGMHAHG